MKKIMFNDRHNLTQAVLNGTKTITRRLVGDRMTDDDIKAYLNGYTELANKCAYYKIGEVVAVAQCYETLANSGYLNEMTTPANNAVGCEFKKDYCNRGWSNKMFVKPALMPHQIEITDIKVEHLQDISDEDCIKEGIIIDTHREVLDDNVYMFEVLGKHYCQWHFPNPRVAFAALIERPGVGRKGLWKSNPYIFAYSFKLIK